MSKRIPTLLSLTLLAAFCGSAQAEVLGWYAKLAGGKVVPPQANAYEGVGQFAIKTISGQQKLSCLMYATFGHGTARVHLGAPGTNGPLLGSVPVSAVGAWLGYIPVDAAAIAELQAGNAYAEITSVFGDVIRGQLTATYSVSGTGCPSSLGTPSISGIGVPLPGSTIYLNATGGELNGSGLIFVGVTQANLPLPYGCTLLVAPETALIVPVPLSAAGAWSAGQVQVPDVPFSVQVELQFFAFASATPALPFSASRRLSVNVSTFPY